MSVYNIPFITEADDILNNSNSLRLNEKTLVKTLQELNNYKNIIYTNVCKIPMLTKTFDGFERYSEYESSSSAAVINGKKYFQAKCIMVNNNALNEYSPDLSVGRYFDKLESGIDFSNTNYIPVILGAAYSNKYKIGDSFEVYLGENAGYRKTKVIGILKPNQFIPYEMRAFAETEYQRYLELDNSIVVSYSMSVISKKLFFTHVLFEDNLILINGKSDISETLLGIKKIFKSNLGIEIGIQNFDKYVNQELDSLSSQADVMNTTLIVIMLFIFFTLIVSYLNSIEDRKKEFGVQIFCGGTLTNIAFDIFKEITIITCSAFLITLPILIFQYGYLNFRYVNGLFLGFILLSILTALYPMKRILSLSVNELIKGEE